jgi:hypothetical protein
MDAHRFIIVIVGYSFALNYPSVSSLSPRAVIDGNMKSYVASPVTVMHVSTQTPEKTVNKTHEWKNNIVNAIRIVYHWRFKVVMVSNLEVRIRKTLPCKKFLTVPLIREKEASHVPTGFHGNTYDHTNPFLYTTISNDPPGHLKEKMAQI